MPTFHAACRQRDALHQFDSTHNPRGAPAHLVAVHSDLHAPAPRGDAHVGAALPAEPSGVASQAAHPLHRCVIAHVPPVWGPGTGVRAGIGAGHIKREVLGAMVTGWRGVGGAATQGGRCAAPPPAELRLLTAPEQAGGLGSGRQPKGLAATPGPPALRHWLGMIQAPPRACSGGASVPSARSRQEAGGHPGSAHLPARAGGCASRLA